MLMHMLFLVNLNYMHKFCAICSRTCFSFVFTLLLNFTMDRAELSIFILIGWPNNNNIYSSEEHAVYSVMVWPKLTHLPIYSRMLANRRDLTHFMS